jgi:hypothetical protein
MIARRSSAGSLAAVGYLARCLLKSRFSLISSTWKPSHSLSRPIYPKDGSCTLRLARVRHHQVTSMVIA